ncbi:MAG: LPS export ABC transporter permease LptG, partial [Beijerinckiaceae bacterium]
GFTLGRYLSLRFLQSIGAVFLTVFGLIYLIDLVELIRRAGEGANVSTWALARLSFFRTPLIAEQVLPFAVLFGSLVAFLGLSRKLELVIARAAGVSVWQFGLPPALVALLIGLAAMMIYNPVAVSLKQRAAQLEGRVFARTDTARAGAQNQFIRQLSVDGSSIIRAGSATADGTSLFNVTVFVFDRTGLLIERVEAESAALKRGHWQLEKARMVTVGIEPQRADRYLLATNLTRDEARQALGSTENITFWRLPATIRQLELAGLDATRYRLRYQSLMARPLLLVAMVILAACVSLRFFRFGGVAKLVLGGVAAGFLLYIATQIAEDLGAAGTLSAPVAAWLPAILGALLGILVLLHQEDG